MTHVESFFSGEVMAQHWSDGDDGPLMAVKKGAKKSKKTKKKGAKKSAKTSVKRTRTKPTKRTCK